MGRARGVAAVVMGVAGVGVGTGGIAARLQAQTAGATGGAAAITATDVARDVAALAADSMRPRETPSAALERTARYVAERFRQLGLEPGNRDRDGTSWLWHYPMPGYLRVNTAKSYITFGTQEGAGADAAALPDVVADFTTGAWSVFDTISSGQVGWGSAPVVLVSGRHDPASPDWVMPDPQSTVVYVPPLGTDNAMVRAVIAELYRSRRAQGVIVVGADETDDSVRFAARLRAARQRPPVLVDRYLVVTGARSGWAVHVQAGVVAGYLARFGVDLARVRADSAPSVRALPGAAIELEAVADTVDLPVPSAPIVVGVLPGTDTTQDQHFVVTAHMDQAAADGSAVDAVDNAAGVAGLLALAKAFGQPGARPRRTLVFVATSGTHRGVLGGRAFTADPRWQLYGAVNLHMTGHAPGDSVTVDGVRELEFGTRPGWILALQPELGLTLVEGERLFRPEYDQWPYVRRVVPSLSFRTGGAPGRIDPERTARIVRFAYYVIQDMAKKMPRWSAAGREAGRQLWEE